MSSESTSQPNAVRLPSASELGLPLGAQGLYNRLAVETVGDFDGLVLACKQHVVTFEVQAQFNKKLPVEDARQLGRVIETLVERTEQGSRERALVWVVGRYFVIFDDGDPDFTVTGLDDDVAVCNAVCAYLGHTDLQIEV